MVVLNRAIVNNAVTLHLSSDGSTTRIMVKITNLSSTNRVVLNNLAVQDNGRAGTFNVDGTGLLPGMASFVVSDAGSGVELVDILAFVTESGNVTADFTFTEYNDNSKQVTSYLP